MTTITAESTQRIRAYLSAHSAAMFRPAGKGFLYPFLMPGSSSYQDMLWDWDSCAPLSATGDDATVDWPPMPCDPPAGLDKIDGRKIDTYHHGARQEWAYPSKNSFPVYIVHPSKDRENAPLYVVLHSAGHSAETCMKDGYQRSPDGAYNNHGLFHAPDEFYGLYQQGDAWWGRDGGAVEKRVLDVVAWAVAKYGIDSNRVYLAGISMGGSGSLGIGMRHGEVFASEMVWVPAGTGHVAHNMFFGQKTPPEAAIPDPPVLYSRMSPGY